MIGFSADALGIAIDSEGSGNSVVLPFVVILNTLKNFEYYQHLP